MGKFVLIIRKILRIKFILLSLKMMKLMIYFKMKKILIFLDKINLKLWLKILKLLKIYSRETGFAGEAEDWRIYRICKKLLER